MGQAPHTAPDEFYHIYNRGTDRREIFSDTSDYERFVSLLYLLNTHTRLVLNRRNMSLEHILCKERGETLVDICGYCLMPNHFHILLKEKAARGTSKFMQKLLTGYAMYFNTKYQRTGTLFQGKYKAQHANNDIYLRYLIAYIHLNPMKLIDPLWKEQPGLSKKEREDFLQAYQYSSFQDYIGKKRSENNILNREVMPLYFESTQAFKEKMYEWFNFYKKER